MNKIKKITDRYKSIFNKFPLTFISIIVLTIFYAVVYEKNNISEDIIISVSLFTITFGFSTFFIECIPNKISKTYKIILYIVSLVISGICTFIYNYNGVNHIIYKDYLCRFIFFYLPTTFIYSIYSIYKSKNVDLNEYLVKTYTALFKNTLIYQILAVGLTLVSLIFIILLLDGESFTILGIINILLLGIYYIPNALYSLLALDDDIGTFIKVIIKYVLDIIVITAFIVIYSYMIKILFKMEVPSNQIFRITVSLFIIGLPIWTLASYFSDDGLLSKINSKLPYAFIPFIFLQIYSIGIRCINHGLTPMRYLCFALIILEVIYLILYHIDKNRLYKIFYVLIVLITLSSITPYINMFKLSEINQTYIIKSLLKKANSGIKLSNKELVKSKGAYYYLKNTSNGDKLIKNLLTDKDKKILKINSKNSTNNIKYLYAYNYNKELDIYGYNKLYEINKTIYRKDFDNKNINLTKLEFKVNNNTFILNINDLIKDYTKESSNNFKSYFKYNNTYILDNNKKIILDSINIKYDLDTNKIVYLSLSGYLLTK